VETARDVSHPYARAVETRKDPRLSYRIAKSDEGDAGPLVVAGRMRTTSFLSRQHLKGQTVWPAGYGIAGVDFLVMITSMPATSYRYLINVPGVRSGRTIVEGTRIGVHDVIGFLQNGETIDTLIARCFPSLTHAQVYECLAYYEDHRGEIDLLVAQQLAPGGS